RQRGHPALDGGVQPSVRAEPHGPVHAGAGDARGRREGRPGIPGRPSGDERHPDGRGDADRLHDRGQCARAGGLGELGPEHSQSAATSRAPSITYNTQRLTGDAVPTTLQDLLKPQYRGRIASTSYAAFWDRVATPEIWGEQRTIDYVTKLADQVSGLTRCGESERLATGEFDLLAIDCGGGGGRQRRGRGAPGGSRLPPR